MTAYCPLARGKVPGNETLERIGKAHGKSASQVALRYLVQQGIIPIPRTAKPRHLAANLAVFDFKLGDGRDGRNRQAQASRTGAWSIRRMRRSGIAESRRRCVTHRLALRAGRRGVLIALPPARAVAETAAPMLVT